MLPTTLFPIVADALESSNTVVVIFEQQAITAFSSAFVTFSGYAPAELTGQNLAFIAKPATASLAEITAALHAGKPYRGDLACIAKDHSPRWLGLHLVPAGRHAVLIGRDITAQRRESATARLIQSALLKLFMTIDTAIAIVAADERIILANPHLDTLLAAPPGSLAGQKLSALVAPAFRQRLAEASGTAESWQAELELLAGPATLPALLRVTRMGGAEMAGVTTAIITPSPAVPAEPATLRMAGKIRFVSLDPLRSGLQDKWAVLGPRIAHSAEALVRGWLDPADTLVRSADRGFLICFAHATEDDASAIAAAIARDLVAHLATPNEAEPAARVAATVSKVVVAATGPPDMAQIGRHMEAAEATLRARPWPAPRAVPILSAPDGMPAATLIAAPPHQAGGARLAFSETGLEQALAALRLAATLSQPHWVLAGVEFGLFLNRAGTEAIEEACAGLPAHLRERLCLVLTAPPRGTTRSFLSDMLRRLTRVCGGFAFQLEDMQLPDIDLAAHRPAAMVIDLKRQEGGRTLQSDRLKRLTTPLQIYRIRTLALNVATLETARSLARYGVNWITLDP